MGESISFEPLEMLKLEGVPARWAGEIKVLCIFGSKKLM